MCIVWYSALISFSRGLVRGKKGRLYGLDGGKAIVFVEMIRWLLDLIQN